MLNTIRWSSFADADFANILEYLESKWNKKVTLEFIEILDSCIIQINTNPTQFPVFNTNLNIRKCIVTKHNTLYYRITKNQIEILRLYDTRQNPNELKFSI